MPNNHSEMPDNDRYGFVLSELKNADRIGKYADNPQDRIKTYTLDRIAGEDKELSRVKKLMTDSRKLFTDRLEKDVSADDIKDKLAQEYQKAFNGTDKIVLKSARADNAIGKIQVQKHLDRELMQYLEQRIVDKKWFRDSVRENEAYRFEEIFRTDKDKETLRNWFGEYASGNELIDNVLVSTEHTSGNKIIDNVLMSIQYENFQDCLYESDASLINRFADKYRRISRIACADILLDHYLKPGDSRYRIYNIALIRAKIQFAKKLKADYDARIKMISSPYYTIVARKDIEKYLGDEGLNKLERDKKNKKLSDGLYDYLLLFRDAQDMRYGKGKTVKELLDEQKTENDRINLKQVQGDEAELIEKSEEISTDSKENFEDIGFSSERPSLEKNDIESQSDDDDDDEQGDEYARERLFAKRYDQLSAIRVSMLNTLQEAKISLMTKGRKNEKLYRTKKGEEVSEERKEELFISDGSVYYRRMARAINECIEILSDEDKCRESEVDKALFLLENRAIQYMKYNGGFGGLKSKHGSGYVRYSLALWFEKYASVYRMQYKYLNHELENLGGIQNGRLSGYQKFANAYKTTYGFEDYVLKKDEKQDYFAVSEYRSRFANAVALKDDTVVSFFRMYSSNMKLDDYLDDPNGPKTIEEKAKWYIYKQEFDKIFKDTLTPQETEKLVKKFERTGGVGKIKTMVDNLKKDPVFIMTMGNKPGAFTRWEEIQKDTNDGMQICKASYRRNVDSLTKSINYSGETEAYSKAARLVVDMILSDPKNADILKHLFADDNGENKDETFRETIDRKTERFTEVAEDYLIKRKLLGKRNDFPKRNILEVLGDKELHSKIAAKYMSEIKKASSPKASNMRTMDLKDDIYTGSEEKSAISERDSSQEFTTIAERERYMNMSFESDESFID